MAAADQPGALHAALSAAAHLQTPACRLEVRHVSMSNRLAAALTEAWDGGWKRISLSHVTWPLGVTAKLPRLRSLRLNTPLTDGLVTELRQCVTWAERLYPAGGLQLQTPLPAGTVLPWGVMMPCFVGDMTQNYIQGMLLYGEVLGPHSNLLSAINEVSSMQSASDSLVQHAPVSQPPTWHHS